jgi:hypothetical protein
MHRHACIFCGDTRMVVYKQIATADVLSIVDRQLEAGMRDPAVVFLRNFTRHLRVRGAGAGDADAADADADAADADADADAARAGTPPDKEPLQCCICCFHWTSRRLHLPITVLPMQCLLYFVLGVNSVESKQCDTRVLKRLATTIGEEQNNVWRTIFQAQELEAIDFILQKKRHCAGAQESFCVKRELAAFYHAQNGSGMLVASSSVADMLRAPCPRLL